MIRRTICAALLTYCMGILSGCATTTIPVSILYSPSVEARGGSGNLFLKSGTGNTAISNADNVRWVIGKRKDSDGMVTGEILSVSSAGDIVLDALKRELTVAGYRVELGASMPSGVPKGIDLASVQVELEETAGIPKIEITCTVKISMDVWKNGAKMKRLSYETRVSDFAIIDRERLPRDMIEKGLRGVMSQAVPEIVAVLNGKS